MQRVPQDRLEVPGQASLLRPHPPAQQTGLVHPGGPADGVASVGRRDVGHVEKDLEWVGVVVLVLEELRSAQGVVQGQLTFSEVPVVDPAPDADRAAALEQELVDVPLGQGVPDEVLDPIDALRELVLLAPQAEVRSARH